jgi:hypothetical protein
MKFSWLILVLALWSTGCTSRSQARLHADNAFLAGQNVALQQQAAKNGVTILGAVQNPQVPWVVGLTLAQALATANYVGAQEPKAIIITRQGESAVLEASVLLNGTEIPLEVGDVVELR